MAAVFSCKKAVQTEGAYFRNSPQCGHANSHGKHLNGFDDEFQDNDVAIPSTAVGMASGEA